MDDPFTRELRAARARIAELQRRHGAAGDAGRRLLPEALAEVDTALEELAVTGSELQAQTAELAATRDALEAERERYQELFQSAPVAYLVTDPVGRVREANRAAAELLEARPEFLPGKPLAAFVAYDDRFTFRVMLNRLRLGEEAHVEDAPLRLRRGAGGEAAAVLVTVAAVRDREGAVRALRWLVRDTAGADAPAPLLVVSVDQAIRQAAARRRQLETLAELDPVEDLDGTVQLVLDAGTHLVRVDATACMLTGREGRLASVGASGEAASAFARAQEHLTEGPGVDAVRHDRTVWSSDLAADPRWSRLKPAAAVNRVGAVMAVPVSLYGGPIGVCLLLSGPPRPWTDGDVEAAQAYAGVLAGLLEMAAEAQRSVALAQRVQEALARRTRVERATGVLMARGGLEAPAALAALRERARRSGRPLDEAARRVLEEPAG
jgi:PAS domain S-box-containing protein